MAGLTFAILTADSERFYGALTLAAAYAAQGKDTHIYCTAAAIPLLVPPHTAIQDGIRQEHGLPSLGQLIADAVDLGARFSACQSGLALHQLTADQLIEECEIIGPIALFGQLGEDRLTMI